MELARFPDGNDWRAGYTLRRAEGGLGGVLPSLGWSDLPVFRLRQQHGCHIVAISETDVSGPPLPEGDGLMTSRRGVVLTVASADCVPIVLFDAQREAGAVLHAGWRGTRLRIAQEGVAALGRRFGSRPEGLRALMGPAIGPCCYRVGQEVEDEFRRAGLDLTGLWREDEAGRFLDLPGANRRQLVSAGLDPGRIHAAELCTHCLPDRFPS